MGIGTNLKNLRKQSKLTQVELAEMLSIKQSNISDWEHDITRPEYENLMRLSVIFDTTTDYLLGLRDECGNETEFCKKLSKQISEVKGK